MTEVEHQIQELQAQVGLLPDPYLALLRSLPKTGCGRRFRERDGEESQLALLYPNEVLSHLLTSTVNVEDGLLLFGLCGEIEYILGIADGRVYRHVDSMPWGAKADELELIEPDIARFIEQLSTPPLRPIDLMRARLREFAESATPAELEEWIRAARATDQTRRVDDLVQVIAGTDRVDLMKVCLLLGCNRDRVFGWAVRGRCLAMVTYLAEEVRLPDTSTSFERGLSTREILTYLARTWTKG